MVFSSVPLYLDPPNWNNQQQQQQQHQQLSHHGQLFPSGGGVGVEVHHHQQQHQHQHQQHQQQQHQQQQHVHQQHQPPPPVPPPPGALMAPRPDTMGGGAVAVNGGDGGGGPTGGAVVRPGSMTDRARMAKIPQPEPGLKCPRPGCESTNTKFCYFNNYSLTQPRHFCKTCRRYWTRGGALRNVPVGGGCRRNKRSKSSKSSSSVALASGATTGGTSSSTSSTTTGGGNSGAAAIMPPQAGHAQAQMPFFASLHPMGSGGGDHYGTGASRLGFPGLSSLDPVDYQLGGGSAAAAAALGMEQWRLPQMQQFPFFGRADGMQQHQQMAGIYPFDAATDADGFAVTGQIMGGGGSKQVPGSAGLITQLASVKMEDNPPSNSAMASAASAREFLGLPGNLQFWGGGNNGAGGNDNGASHSGGAVAPGGGGGGWVDLSGFNSSSSGNIM